MVPAACFAVVVAISSSVSAFADVVIRNASKYEITEVYVAPESIESWGEDSLKDQILPPDGKLTLTGVVPGSWDFKLVFREKGGKESWHCILQGIALDATGDDSTFDTEMLDKCSENSPEEE